MSVLWSVLFGFYELVKIDHLINETGIRTIADPYQYTYYPY